MRVTLPWLFLVCLCPSISGSLVDAMVSLPPVAGDFLDAHIHVIGTSTIISRGCGGIPLHLHVFGCLSVCVHLAYARIGYARGSVSALPGRW